MRVEPPQGVGQESYNHRHFKKPEKKSKKDDYTSSFSDTLDKVEITPQQLFLIEGISFTKEEIELIKESL
jgi:hypothetical protein